MTDYFIEVPQPSSGGTEDIIFSSSSASTIPLKLQGSASQTANLLEVEDSVGTTLSQIDSEGRLRFKQSAGSITDPKIMNEDDSYSGIAFLGTGANAEVTVTMGTASWCKFGKNGVVPFGAQYAIRAASNGSASLPQYAWTSDGDTGLYRIGTNNMGISAGSTLCLDINSDRVISNAVFMPGQYATVSLPLATSYEGGVVYDTTTQTIKWSNGTVWATI